MGIEDNKSETERAHFFNAKQKEVKGKIMRELIDVLFGNLQNNLDIFDMQSAIDLFGSILIMFNREVLVHILITANVAHARKDILKALFESVRDEVNREIKLKMM